MNIAGVGMSTAIMYNVNITLQCCNLKLCVSVKFQPCVEKTTTLKEETFAVQENLEIFTFRGNKLSRKMSYEKFRGNKLSR